MTDEKQEKPIEEILAQGLVVTDNGVVLLPEQNSQIEGYREKALSLKADTTDLMILDEEKAAEVTQDLQSNLVWQDGVKKFFSEKLKRPISLALDTVRQMEKDVLEPACALEQIQRTAISSWMALRKRIEEEQNRLERENSKRLADESTIHMATVAEAAGASKKVVDGILSSPQIVTRYAAQTPVIAKPKGISMKAPSYWAEIPGYTQNGELLKEPTDETKFREMLKAIVERRAPLNVVMPNMTTLNGLARHLKKTLNIDGVEVRSDDGGINVTRKRK